MAQAMSLAQPAVARVIERVQQDDPKDEARRILPPLKPPWTGQNVPSSGEQKYSSDMVA